MENMAGRNTLMDDAADKIRQMIFSGQIKPGELLPPRKELAARFGVGTSTIHAAVKSLDAVGLLESRPGKGTWVRHDALDSVIRPAIITNRFGQIDVETIYEARLMLEVSLAEMAAQKATPKMSRPSGRPIVPPRVSSMITKNLPAGIGIFTWR